MVVGVGEATSRENEHDTTLAHLVFLRFALLCFADTEIFTK